MSHVANVGFFCNAKLLVAFVETTIEARLRVNAAQPSHSGFCSVGL